MVEEHVDTRSPGNKWLARFGSNLRPFLCGNHPRGATTCPALYKSDSCNLTHQLRDVAEEILCRDNTRENVIPHGGGPGQAIHPNHLLKAFCYEPEKIGLTNHWPSGNNSSDICWSRVETIHGVGMILWISPQKIYGVQAAQKATSGRHDKAIIACECEQMALPIEDRIIDTRYSLLCPRNWFNHRNVSCSY